MSPTSSRPLAVVTGASKGIGFELAKLFAANGYDLIVNSHTDALDAAAATFRTYGVDVQAVEANLATDDGVHAVYERIKAAGRPVAALALNAGRGAGGAFVGDTSLHDELEIIDLNVRSTVHLAKHVLKNMVARGGGRVLITSSIAATMPGSYQAVYNASKAFTQSFAEAIRNELKDTGVTVTSLQPGATDTEFFDTADMRDTKLGAEPPDDPARVAKQGFEAMLDGKDSVVAGNPLNKVQAVAAELLPERLTAQMHRKAAEPGSA